ncbi:MAG TPA: hypothetical protein VFE51_30040 [Verrucomicrobiae bacterium]|nr:hypothetical protein [Verrucomicrobiae bacterium]
MRGQLDLAKAAEQQAEADYRNAHLVYARLEAVDKVQPHLVAQQELDNAKAKDLIAKANLSAAKAEVEKRKALMEKADVMTSLDVRRLNAELDVAKASEQIAEADYRNAHLRLERLSAVDGTHSNLVVPADLETAKAKGSVAEAALSAAKVEVEKWQKRLTETKDNPSSDAKNVTR